MNKIIKLLLSIFFCQSAGIIGSFFTAPSITEWYSSLQKPAFALPNWIFAPVWISLFFLMGISLYLIWEKGFNEKEVRVAISIFLIHLVLNILWSFLFFGLQSPLYGFIEIVILWLIILLTIIVFYKISKRAALLLIPYICWVSIAATLNFFIWRLNL